MSKSTSPGKTRGTSTKAVGAPTSRTIAIRAAAKHSHAEQPCESVVTVPQGISDGFVVLGSPIQPKHTSVDLISAAVRALRAR